MISANVTAYNNDHFGRSQCECALIKRVYRLRINQREPIWPLPLISVCANLSLVTLMLRIGPRCEGAVGRGVATDRVVVIRVTELSLEVFSHFRTSVCGP